MATLDGTVALVTGASSRGAGPSSTVYWQVARFVGYPANVRAGDDYLIAFGGNPEQLAFKSLGEQRVYDLDASRVGQPSPPGTEDFKLREQVA